ncbi:unnamed protein product [Heterobilharzia americana]|nr:unnamed protein product [Heterobilharzia americana]
MDNILLRHGYMSIIHITMFTIRLAKNLWFSPHHAMLCSLLLAAVLTVILAFMTIIRGRFPVNLFIALLAVISLSFSAATLLANLELLYAIIVLTVTVVIFIMAAVAGFLCKNLSRRGWFALTSISAGLFVIGVITAGLSSIYPTLVVVAGAFWSVEFILVIFITTKFLKFGRFNPNFSLALFLAYILWFEEIGLCLSISQCFIYLNITQNNFNYKDYQSILITVY